MARLRFPLLAFTFAAVALAAWPWSGDSPTPPQPIKQGDGLKQGNGLVQGDGLGQEGDGLGSQEEQGDGLVHGEEDGHEVDGLEQGDGLGQVDGLGQEGDGLGSQEEQGDGLVQGEEDGHVAKRTRAVPANPTHGHHPEASHEWHEIPGVKTTYKVLKAGDPSGAYIRGGDTVTMHATGTLKDSGKKFWSTKDVGHKPFTYKQGAGVIRAWDAGTRGMRVGERRQLIIPAREAYGADGFTHWDVPPQKDLEFELEVLKIKSKLHMEL